MKKSRTPREISEVIDLFSGKTVESFYTESGRKLPKRRRRKKHAIADRQLNRLTLPKFHMSEYVDTNSFINAMWRANKDYLEPRGIDKSLLKASIENEFINALGLDPLMKKSLKKEGFDPLVEARRTNKISKLKEALEGYSRQSSLYIDPKTGQVEVGGYFMESFLPEKFGQLAEDLNIKGLNKKTLKSKKKLRDFIKENFEYVSAKAISAMGLAPNTEAFRDKRTGEVYYSDVEYGEDGYPVYVWRKFQG